MNTSRYRQLLASFNEQVSARDIQAGRLTSKWLELFDNLTTSTQQGPCLLIICPG